MRESTLEELDALITDGLEEQLEIEAAMGKLRLEELSVTLPEVG